MSFGMSDVGVVSSVLFTEADQISRVAGLAFSQPADAAGPAISMNIVAVEHGSLMIALARWPRMLDFENEDALMDELSGGILQRMDVISLQSSSDE